MCARGLDAGTMFLVKGEIDPVMDSEVFTVERNAFLEAASTDDTEDTFKEQNWSYAKHDGKFYILGEDAIRLKNLLSVSSSVEDRGIVATKIGELRRPMKDGILNTAGEKLSIAIIQKIMSSLLGSPSYPGEPLCFCAPGDPVDSNLTVHFHRQMLTAFLQSLGYSVECIQEAFAIILSQQPSTTDPDGQEVPLSGISFSFGAGMCNVCFAFRKIPLINFSVARGGDWIDRESAKVAGVEVPVITRFKEKNFNLDKVDVSDLKQAALDIFYQSMIEHALTNFATKFNQLENQYESPMEIVVAGGTASVPGFINKFKQVLSGLSLPFAVKDVRLADNPLYAVSHGCLVKALYSEKKLKNEQKSSKKDKN